MTGDLVPYKSPTAHHTRSQASKAANPSSEDILSRLETIPLTEVEAILSRQTRKHQPECSLLSYLQEPGQVHTAASAATNLLEELADGVEGISTTTALVVRYVQAHRLWEAHPNPAIDSLQALLGTVDGFQYIQAAAVIGTSSQFMKAKIITLIEGHWGSQWFEEIPAAMKDHDWARASDCSHNLLTLMAANAEQDIALASACDGWAKSIARRRDERIREETKMRWPRVPYIIPEDVQSLNRILKPDQQGRRTVDMFYPDKMAEDQFNVELVPRKQQLQFRTGYAGCGPSAGKKRKHSTKVPLARAKDTDPQGDRVGDVDGWRLAKDGKWMLKRDGKQVIRKQIQIVEDRSTPISSDCSSGESSLDRLTTNPKENTPDDDLTDNSKRRRDSAGMVSRASCEGPRLANALRELVKILEEGTSDIPAITAMAECCCDTCSPQLRMVNSILGDLKRVASLLEATVKHTIRGAELGSAQSHARTLPSAI
jgi:hypothetical protein